jgi:DNA-directed RNA polymerase sigma subunit (sigma70/sigma32)
MGGTPLNYELVNDHVRTHVPLDPETDSLLLLMRETRRYELLTHEEHMEFAVRAQAGDRDALEKMVNHNLRLIITIAKKPWGRGCHF